MRTWLGAGLLIFMLNLVPVWPPMARAEPPGGMCAGQGEMTARELEKALSLMREIMSLEPGLTPGDEETIIRGRGLTAARLNCLLGKFMAGNDIFNWGHPAAYGVYLTEGELTVARRFADEAGPLRKYLEESLNIRAEDR